MPWHRCAAGCPPQARLFVGAGVDKIRLTGGEPMLRPGAQAHAAAGCAASAGGPLAPHQQQCLGACVVCGPAARVRHADALPSAPCPADLVELTRRLSGLPGVKAVGLTSNGLTLGRKLAALKEAGTCHRLGCAAGKHARLSGRPCAPCAVEPRPRAAAPATLAACRPVPTQHQPGHAAAGAVCFHDAAAGPRARAGLYPAGGGAGV